MRVIAYFVSGLFHPLFLPVFVVMAVMYADPLEFRSLTYQGRLTLLIRLVANGIFFPVAVILLLKGLKFIKDLQLKGREDRILVMIAILFFYLWTFFSFFLGEDPHSYWAVYFLGGSLAATLIFLGLVLHRNLSMHAAGAGVYLAFVYGLGSQVSLQIDILFLAVILLGGLTGSARLFLQAHTPRQIYLGFFIGFLSQALAWKMI